MSLSVRLSVTVALFHSRRLLLLLLLLLYTVLLYTRYCPALWTVRLLLMMMMMTMVPRGPMMMLPGRAALPTTTPSRQPAL
jgi:hypothetical protein